MKTYSIRKCKKILLGSYTLLRRKKKRLLPAQVNEIRQDLQTLQKDILEKNQDGANYHARKCLEYGNGLLQKSNWEQLRDFVFALVFALAVALLIRQVWFELYEIPTGSMRPTFKEKDRLIVSKTKFGINFPFSTKHLYFEPDLVKRSDIIVFSVENLDVHDPDTMYFWLFPGKKQFVKRMMGRPDDTVYFYGGQIYGIDVNGHDVSSLYQPKILSHIDHVPMIRFDGNVAVSEPFKSKMGNAYRMSIIHQMGEAVARLNVLGSQRLEGELLYTPWIHNRDAPMPENYYDLWGMGNYGVTRIVRKSDLRNVAQMQGLPLENADLFLEIKHHPNLKQLELAKDLYGRVRPQFLLSTSVIPLNDDHLKAIFDNLYTARFVVKNGHAKSYSQGGSSHMGTHFLTRLEEVPDGTYEFYHGQGYQIKFGGYAKKLAQGHPLTKYSPDLVRKLYNYGINFDRRLALGPHFETSRFAYFKYGNLCLLGAPIFKQVDPALEAFVKSEKEREESANAQRPYAGFLDEGPPILSDGTINQEKIKRNGLLIAEGMYLALGDNFAMSSDSRDFGLVPQGNLRGSPSVLFWPPGERIGAPLQPSARWFTVPNVVVWSLALICFLFWWSVHNRHHRLPLKDLE